MDIIDLLLGEGLTAGSAKNYARVFNNIHDVRSVEAVDDYVSKKKARIPQLTMLKRVMDLLEMNTDHLEELFEKYSSERERSFAAPSPGQTSHWKSWPEVVDIVSALNKKKTMTFNEYQTWVVGMIITQVAPLRNSSIRNLVVWTGEGSRPPDCIDTTTDTLVLSNYKTAAKYGRRIYELPTGFASRLVAFRTKLGVTSKFLITTKDGKRQINPSAMSAFLQDSPLGMGSSTWRAVYISFLTDSGASAESFKRAAKLMNHSVTEQQLTYTKFRGTKVKEAAPMTTAERHRLWRAKKKAEDPDYFARKAKAYRARKTEE